MALEKLVEKFNKDNTKALEQIEKLVKPDIDAVRKAQKVFLKLDTKSYERINNFQQELAAHKSVLDDWYCQLEALVRNKEHAYFQMLVNQAELEETKFVATKAEHSAALAVAEERRLRNKIQGAQESAIGLIHTCRNIMNNAKNSGQIDNE